MKIWANNIVPKNSVRSATERVAAQNVMAKAAFVAKISKESAPGAREPAYMNKTILPGPNNLRAFLF